MRKSIFFIFMFLYTCGLCQGAASYNTGFRTMGVWNPENGMRFDFNIWYPAKRSPQLVNFSRWAMNVALNAKPVEEKFPVLIISHASPGSRFSYSYLASYFTNRGYIVIAPGHPTDYMDNMDDLFTWQQLSKRVSEINATLDLLLQDKTFGPLVDQSRVGLIGFGSGAAAALLLCGAKPDCSRWAMYCPHAGQGDVYCSKWATDRINTLCQSLPLKQSLLNKRIKAVALIAPAFGMLFAKSSFVEVNLPILLVGAGRDNFNREELHCEPIARILGKKASYLALPNADAGALMSACTPTLESELPELCTSVTNEERQSIHQKLEFALATFFNRYINKAQ